MATRYAIQSVIGRYWPMGATQDGWTAEIRHVQVWGTRAEARGALTGLQFENRPGAAYAKVVELCEQID